jgi:hypothetical protein
LLSNLHTDGPAAAQLPRTPKRKATEQLIALRLDFVAKPEGSHAVAGSLAKLLETARLDEAGLVSSILLVSDREARLVTLLTFWEVHRFLPARERRIGWMQKLLAPFADGAVRAHTSVANFLAGAPGMAVSPGLLDAGSFRGASLLAAG